MNIRLPGGETPGAFRLARVVLALALCTCIGGCGSAISVTPETVNFSGRLGGNAPAPQAVEVRSNGGMVYAKLNYNSGPKSPIQKATLTITDEIGKVVVFPADPDDIGSGHRSATIRVIACADEHCDSELSESTITVNYDVAPDEFEVSPPQLSFSMTQDDPGPPEQKLALKSALGRQVVWTHSVSYESGDQWLTGQAFDNDLPSALTVGVSPSLEAGTYHATILLQASYIQARVPVTYTVEPRPLAANPTRVSFTISPDTAEARQSQVVTLGDRGTPLSWTASASEPWLTVSPSSGRTSPAELLTLSLDPDKLGKVTRGSYSATVNVSYSGDTVPTKVMRLPVTVNITLPRVDSVAPYVATAGRAEEVIIRGGGFDGLTSEPVLFGTTPASKVTRVSDTELRVTPPVLTAGRYAVRLENRFNLDTSNASLVVVEAQRYSAARIAAASSYTRFKMLHDPERRALYVKTYGRLERYAYDSVANTWNRSEVALPATPAPDYGDFAMTPDGTELLAITGGNLHGIDPVSFTISWTKSLGQGGSDIEIANNGKAILLKDGSTYSFDLVTRALTQYPMNYGYKLAASGDGRRIVISSEGWGTAPDALYYYDASLDIIGQLQPKHAGRRILLDRTGARCVIESTVYDASFKKLGALPDLPVVALSPDGTRAYGYGRSYGYLYTVDLSGPPQANGEYPLLESKSNISGIDSMFVSADGNTLFLAGKDYVYVQPLPLP